MSPAPAPTRAAMRDFLWGVATSAYQSEGGYNGPGQPQTNWAEAEAADEVFPSGPAVDFWNLYRSDFMACERMGLNAFRLSIEWSRVQPAFSRARGAPPPFDTAALDRYALMLAECRRCRLEPVVTLHHFVHPAWLGPDPWLDAATIDLFEAYVRAAIRHVNSRLVEVYGQPPVRCYITINEPNTLAINTYVTRQFPGGPAMGSAPLQSAYSHLLAAHVRAYDAIHDYYRERDWPPPLVSFNNYCVDLYWIDKLLLDLVSLKERGVEPGGIAGDIAARARAFEATYRAARIPLRRGPMFWIGEAGRRALLRLGHRRFRPELYGSLLREFARSRRRRFLDFLAVDYYDPFTAHILRPPSFYDLEVRSKSFRIRVMNSLASKWWDWHVLPRGLRFFCRHYSEDFGGRPVFIVENGMAMRKKYDNRHSPRRDRVYRSEFLNLHTQEVQRILEDGVPLMGYLYWSLFDNYEWGSYTPRFGLFTIDYQMGPARLVEDHLGDRPSETYAALIRAARREDAAPPPEGPAPCRT